jgi:hypothetical protein
MEYPKIGKRLNPPEGIEPKLGDVVTYEVIYEDEIGTISSVITQFDLDIANSPMDSFAVIDIDRLHNLTPKEK